MKVLYNGEYQEYDITRNNNWEQTVEYNNYRQAYVNQQFGDFKIVSVDYDWGTRRQVNIGRCINCGTEKEIPDLAAFKRGKGVGQLCKCRYKKKEWVSPSEIYERYVGKTLNGFLLLYYKENRGFRVECIECGKQKWATGKSIMDGKVKCNHRIVTDYSDPKYIGMKVGSLTAIAREGNKIRFRCDCGEEQVRVPSAVFGDNGVRSCGKSECIYHKAALYGGNDRRLRGLKFEAECAAEIEKRGYPIKMTPGTGDYGVDFFAVIDGERVAFQCKHLKVESMVRAVQEV